MASGKLSIQDKKDLEKFTKFLIYKSVQIIVQSRLGDKVLTQSKPFSSGSDWFNLAIRDIPDVTGETKRALASHLISTTKTLCIEISLKTAEGDTMVLEMWSLGMSEQCDPSVKVSYMVYNRMGLLLKSLFCVTRVTPAYRLSRQQGPENYVICYRIYLGEPQVYNLGGGYNTTKVGAIPTPNGTISLCVSYRTKLLISPQHSCRDLSIELKENHFQRESPKKMTPAKPCHFHAQRSRRASYGDIEHFVGSADSQDMCAISFSTSPPDPLMHPSYYMNQNKTGSGRLHRPTSEDTIHEYEEERPASMPERQISFTQCQKLGAFAPTKTGFQKPSSLTDEDLPFANLYKYQDEKPEDSPSKRSQGSKKSDSSDNDNVENMECGGSTSSSQMSAPDDFVMVELKTPFAGTDGASDLGKFYRECQGAPGLAMFDEEPTVAETLETITDQLAVFEANMKDFDDFVDALQTNE
ncbi:autophagy-related protein 13-like isoform X2 [Lineus longissimus]|uniref:autophagy-related protein 13-like isoform X2 n=1 Tax=Lineus longissimus TaxID=88925 RepID=UPI00315D6D40